MPQQCAPAELFPDMPTKPTALTWEDLEREFEWALLADDLEPFVEDVVNCIERKMKAPTLIMPMRWV
jgi:hypothetical protein